MNRLQEGRAVEGVFRDANAENLYVTTATMHVRRRSVAMKKSRRRCILISTTIFLVVAAAVALTVHTAQELSSSDGEQTRDPFFYDPESRIFNLPRDDHLNYQSRTPQCPDWTSFTAPSTTVTPEWDRQGQEMLKTIKEELRSNTAGGAWANHFGFGTNVLISGDGQKLAVSYEGYAGFDKAFGVHVDVRVWNGTHWDLEQIVTAVRRHHGRDPTDVRYLSMALSKDGNRLAFSDGHGVHVYAYHDEQPENGNKKDRNKKWLPVGDSPLEDGARLRGGRQFGTHLSFNCDGSVLAVAGTTPRSSFLRVYQEEISLPQVDDTVPPTTVHHRYAEMSQIEGKNHGGGIALNGVGDRIAMGSTASEGWRGIVQVFDRNSTDHWNRVGQAVVGETTMELFGGQVALSADGGTLVAASNEGGNNRVAAYRLMPATAEASVEPGILMWQQLGPSLHGDVNEHEHFGADIDINHDGTILAIGAPGDYELFQKKKEEGELPENDAPFVNGRIYVYQLSMGGDGVAGDGETEWTPIDNGELVGGSEGDLYGKSVALSASGSTVVGGAPERVRKAFEHILGGALVYQSVV